MSKEFKNCSLLLAITVVISLGLSGCQSKNDGSLLKCVPAEATSVLAVDFDALFRQAGCPTGVDAQGNWDARLSGVISALCPPDFSEPLRFICQKAGGAERNHVVIFEMADGTGGILTRVADDDRFIDFVLGEDADEIGEVAHYDCYNFNGGILAEDHETVIFTQSVPALEKIVAAVDKERIEEMVGIRQFLDLQGKVASFAINSSAAPSAASIIAGSDKWACLSLDATQQALNVEALAMDRGGKLDSIGAFFSPIDTDVLRFIPANMSAVVAFGKLQSMASELPNLIEGYVPGLTISTVGSTALCASPAASAENLRDFNPMSWNLIDIAKIAPIQREMEVMKIKAMPFAKTVEEGQQWEFSLPGGFNIYRGIYDGFLITSTNREISSQQENSLTQDFSGKHLALVLDLPAGSELQKATGLPFGLTLTAGLEATRLKMRLTFNGTDLPALQALGIVTEKAFEVFGNVFNGQPFLQGMVNQSPDDTQENVADEWEGHELEPV